MALGIGVTAATRPVQVSHFLKAKLLKNTDNLFDLLIPVRLSLTETRVRTV